MTKKGVLLCSVAVLSALLTYGIQATWRSPDTLPAEDSIAFRMAGVTQDVMVQGEDRQEQVTLPDNAQDGTQAVAEVKPATPTRETDKTAPVATTERAPETPRTRVTADRSGTTRQRLNTAKPAPEPAPQPKQKEQPAGNTVITETYIVKQGDTLWTISQAVGVPMPELLKANNLTEQSTIYTGMSLSLPKHQVAPKETAGPQYGELLDWWTEAQYVWPIGKNALIVDLRTGKSFMVRRSYGAFHADVEPLTAQDTAIIKEIWGGWSWATRPVIVEVDGRRLAASANGMPHSIQSITDNNFNGHFCIHFLNSTRHKDNLMQADHQQNVRTAAGQ
jgi:LysM repeat protein